MIKRIAFLLIFLSGFLYAQKETLTVKFVEKNGKMFLHVEGDAPQAKMFLGVSLYPRNYKDPIWDGEHMVIPIKNKGHFSKDIGVDETFRGGYFEVALWKKLVEKKTLYRMSGLVSYNKGVLLPK